MTNNTTNTAAGYTVATAHVTEGLNLAILYRRENKAVLVVLLVIYCMPSVVGGL